MNLQERISTLCTLGEYLKQNPSGWLAAKQNAYIKNPWFIPAFVELSVDNIIHHFLQEKALVSLANEYGIPAQNEQPLTVGITMAGNIPLVGFHDFLTIFMSGHRQVIKPSSKDDVLITYIVDYLKKCDSRIENLVQFSDRLNGCDAFIATGSNNSGRYFEYYFGKYPHIIRRNRTSAAILTGNESPEQLEALSDDILLYFGLGCRNVSKLYVPEKYDFQPLLRALERYNWMKDHDKFRNNYDYQLSLLILNNRFFMSTPATILVESTELFSPISQINYEYYHLPPEDLSERFYEQIQCICGAGNLAFGKAQQPGLTDYADGVDTMAFALGLKK
ncbi:MAG: acyl-CoA reductase [Chitinophagaceae bacterium]|nr:acyl-CoA reductase [Chitinophagaceae bacterium]